MLTLHQQRLVLERAAGETYAEVGERHGISAQRVRNVVREATEQLNWLELELLKARRTDDVVGLAIPYQDQQDRATAISYFEWCVERLRERGVKVKVEHRPTSEGSVFFLADVTNYSGGKK